MADKTTTFRDVAEKGDGVLVRRGKVWTYPTAEMDRSGTNLQLPIEYVPDAEVQQALRDGDLQPATTDAMGAVLAVRVKGDGDAPAAITVVQAGTPEAGTDLPPNSRPSHDAGMKPATAPPPVKAKSPKVEGSSEVRVPQPGDVAPAAGTDASKV